MARQISPGRASRRIAQQLLTRSRSLERGEKASIAVSGGRISGVGGNDVVRAGVCNW